MMEQTLVYKSEFKSFEYDQETNIGTFEGYASTYNNTDRDGDIMLQDAFKKGLENKSVYPMLFNHNRNKVIGKIEVSHDQKGLPFKATLNMNDSETRNIYDLLKMGALDSMSVGFRVKDFTPIDEREPWEGWLIKEAELYEVSVVTIPANPEAQISTIKSAIKEEEVKRKELNERFKYFDSIKTEGDL